MTTIPDIAFFDMDGTLFQPIRTENGKIAESLWSIIPIYLGPEAQMKQREMYQTWDNNGYENYIEWVKNTLTMHAEQGLTKETFEAAVNAAEYRIGLPETFKRLNENDVVTAIITGGFKKQAERVQRVHNIDHVFAACEYYWNDEGEIDGWNIIPTDNKDKVTFARIIAEEHGTSLKDCAFVGDGKNDVWIAERVGTSIAYDADPSMKQASDYILNPDDGATFEQVSRILLPEEE